MPATNEWQHVLGDCGCGKDRPLEIDERPIRIDNTTFRCARCKGELRIRPNWPEDPKEKKRSTNAIDPDTASEADTAFYLYHELKQLGWTVKAEVWCSASKDCGGSRLDLVVFNDRSQAVRIIEVKKHTPKQNSKVFLSDEFQCWYRTDGKLNEQLPKYRRYGIPVDLVVGKRRAEQYVQWAKDRKNQGLGPERCETEPPLMISD
jgi:hypothetical protein